MAIPVTNFAGVCLRKNRKWLKYFYILTFLLISLRQFHEKLLNIETFVNSSRKNMVKSFPGYVYITSIWQYLEFQTLWMYYFYERILLLNCLKRKIKSTVGFNIQGVIISVSIRPTYLLRNSATKNMFPEKWKNCYRSFLKYIVTE